MCFELEPESLRAAAKAAGDAAEQVHAVKLAVVGDLAEALPGSRTGGRSSKLDEHWEETVTTWSAGIDGYAKKLITAAGA